MKIGRDSTVEQMLVVTQGWELSWHIPNEPIIAEAKRCGLNKVLMIVDFPQRMQTPEGLKFLGTDAAIWHKLIDAGLEVYYLHKHTKHRFMGYGTIAPSGEK